MSLPDVQEAVGESSTTDGESRDAHRSPRGGLGLPLSFRSLARSALEAGEGRIVVLIALDVIFALAMAAATPHFLTTSNFKSLLVESSMEFVLATFMAVLLIARMFDLSVDGVVNMCAVITGLLLVAHVPVPLCVVAGLAAGATVGFVNGIAVTKWKMNPLMTTLGTWWATQGIAYGLTNGISPNVFPASFDDIGAGSFLGIRLTIWYLAVLSIGLAWLLRSTRFGYHIYAIGGDPEASRLHGVKVNRVVITAFMMMGLASAFAGIVFAGQLDAASPVTVSGENLRVIAGAVIGGCSLRGGRGTITGTLLGILFLAMLNNAVIVLGINPYWQYTVLGVVVFGAVALDAMVARRRLQE